MKHSISHRLKLPSDLTRGDMILNITGDGEVFIENYKGIVEYTDTNVLVSGKRYQILLTGKCLAVTYYTDDEMRIEGRFENIKFLN